MQVSQGQWLIQSAASSTMGMLIYQLAEQIVAFQDRLWALTIFFAVVDPSVWLCLS